MITVRGCTWTDPKETMEIYTKLEAKYGSDIISPACGDGEENRGCGATTQYVVVTRADIKGSSRQYVWIGPSFVPTYQLEEADNFKCLRVPRANYYIPIQICVPCSAKKAGYRCGLRCPERRAAELQMAREGSMSPAEMETFVTVFDRAFAKGKEKRAEFANKRGTSRYQMKGKREEASA